MRISGSIERGSVFTLLRLLGRNACSGALQLHAPEGEATVWFHHGKVVRATSGSARSLGRLLIDRGHLDDSQVNSAVLFQQRSATPRRIGSILVGLSMVDRPRIGAALATGIRTVIGTAAEWCEGTYQFDPSADVTPDQLFEGLDVETLVQQVEGI